MINAIKCLKKAAITGLAAVLLTSAIPKAKAETTTSLFPAYNFFNWNINQGFIDSLNDSYSKNIRDWNLTPGWKQIEPAKANNSTGIWIESKEKSDIAYVLYGISHIHSNSSYDESYTFTDPDYGIYCDRLTREENDDITRLSAGIKIKKSLSDSFIFDLFNINKDYSPERFTIDISAIADYYYINGTSNFTRIRGPLQNPSTYTQYRNADYKGGNWGGTLEVGFRVNFSNSNNSISIGISEGYSSATLKPSGHETLTSTSSPSPVEKDYSPEFKLEGSYTSLRLFLGFE